MDYTFAKIIGVSYTKIGAGNGNYEYKIKHFGSINGLFATNIISLMWEKNG